MDSLSLIGKVAVVTGASRGIGAETALVLARRGADVHVHYSSSPDAAKAIVDQIKAMGRKADMIKVDLAGKNCGQELFEGIKNSEFGNKVDICVWNGAVARNCNVEELNVNNFEQQYEEQMNINVRSVLLCTMASLPFLNKKDSRIVMISSVSARGGYNSQSVYGGTKAFLEHYAKVWSKELGHKYNLTVNCVNPGPVNTEMWKSTSDEFRAGFKSTIDGTPAAPRIGEPSDIADIIGFLASESSRWVTGSTICANGGLLAN